MVVTHNTQTLQSTHTHNTDTHRQPHMLKDLEEGALMVNISTEQT